MAFPGGSTPPKGPGLSQDRARNGNAVVGNERVWQSSSTFLIGAARKNTSPNCNTQKQPER